MRSLESYRVAVGHSPPNEWDRECRNGKTMQKKIVLGLKNITREQADWIWDCLNSICQNFDDPARILHFMLEAVEQLDGAQPPAGKDKSRSSPAVARTAAKLPAPTNRHRRR
jgi:hypothetical protein